MDRNEYNNQAMSKAEKLLDDLEGAGDESSDDLDEAFARVLDAADLKSTQTEIDADIDAVVAIYNAHFAGTEHVIPVRTAEQAFSGHPAYAPPAPVAPTHPRDIYNQTILEEAIACRVVNGKDADVELDAQIDYVQQSMAAQAGGADVNVYLDGMVDHLRGMLTLGYLDDEDLPSAFRRESELVEVALQLPATQVDALCRAAQAIADTTPRADEAAAFQAILGAIAKLV